MADLQPLLQSYAGADNYPKNLLLEDPFEDIIATHDVQEQLSDVAQELFVVDESPSKRVSERLSKTPNQNNEASIGRNRGVVIEDLEPNATSTIWTVEKLHTHLCIKDDAQVHEGFRHETKEDPRCRLIYIPASHPSHGPLDVTRAVFNRILTWHQVMREFVDFVVAWQQDAPIPDQPVLKQRSRLKEHTEGIAFPSLGRTEHQFELCYSLINVNARKGNPIQFQRVSVDHQFDAGSYAALWLMVAEDDKLLSRYNKLVAVYTKESAPLILKTLVGSLRLTLLVHLMFVYWAMGGWVAYVQTLESGLSDTLRSDVVAEKLTNGTVEWRRPWTESMRHAPRPSKHGDVEAGREREIDGSPHSAIQTCKNIRAERVTAYCMKQQGQTQRLHPKDTLKLQRYQETALEAVRIIESNVQTLQHLANYYYDLPHKLERLHAERRFNRPEGRNTHLHDHREPHPERNSAPGEEHLESPDPSNHPVRFNTSKSPPKADNDRGHSSEASTATTPSLKSISSASATTSDPHEHIRFHISTFSAKIDDTIDAFHRLRDRAQTLADKITLHHRHRSTSLLHSLDARMEQEAIKMRIITIVTLIYLPATFVSTVFGTDIVKYQNDASPPGTGSFSSIAMARWLQASLPLTGVTLLAAWVSAKYAGVYGYATILGL